MNLLVFHLIKLEEEISYKYLDHFTSHREGRVIPCEEHFASHFTKINKTKNHHKVVSNLKANSNSHSRVELLKQKQRNYHHYVVYQWAACFQLRLQTNQRGLPFFRGILEKVPDYCESVCSAPRSFQRLLW